MTTTAKQFITQAQSWLGINEASGGHKEIIDSYNSRRWRGCGFKMKYSGEWCAAFISACAIKTKSMDIIPIDCHCNHIIKKAKKKGIWVENEATIPKVGDLVLYDWQDSGKGNNTSPADHIGVVETVDAIGKTFVVIEGNYKQSVKRRKLKFNARYLRGFVRPRYQTAAKKKPLSKIKSKIKSKK